MEIHTAFAAIVFALLVLQYALLLPSVFGLMRSKKWIELPETPLAGHFYFFGAYIYSGRAPLQSLLVGSKSIRSRYRMGEAKVIDHISKNGKRTEIIALHALPLPLLWLALRDPTIWIFGSKYGAFFSIALLLFISFHCLFSLALFVAALLLKMRQQ